MNNIIRKLRDTLLGNPRLRHADKKLLIVEKSYEGAKKIFAEFVRLVEVEVHSFCNRSCWFCPNVFIDRKNKTHYLDEGLYLSLLKDLASIDYKRKISFSRYNEPFADEIFFTRLEQASKYTPKAKLHAATNGDYLNSEKIKKAYTAGLRSMDIQLYLEKGVKLNIKEVEKLAEKYKNELSILDFNFITNRPDWIEYQARYKGMLVRMYAYDFSVFGVNRGKLDVSKALPRFSPCLQPFYNVYIDYNGNAVLCCNVRSDNPEQLDYVMGNINDKSIFQIFTDEKIVKERNKLIKYGYKNCFCNDCSFEALESTFINRYLSDKKSKL